MTKDVIDKAGSASSLYLQTVQSVSEQKQVFLGSKALVAAKKPSCGQREEVG